MNWVGLSYPTRCPTPATSPGCAASSERASWSRMRFWNYSGLIAVTARKFRWNADGLMRESLARSEIRIRSA